MVTGRSHWREPNRAIVSAAIFAIEYVSMIGRWLSPSGSVSASGCSPAGAYTPVDEHCSQAFAVRQWPMSRPVASAFAARSTSQRLLLTTARFST